MKSNLSLMLVLAAPVLAQSTAKDALTKHWKTSAEFTIAVANTMPAESYNFRPNPEEMNFGQLMAHIADINEYASARRSFCSLMTFCIALRWMGRSLTAADVAGCRATRCPAGWIEMSLKSKWAATGVARGASCCGRSALTVDSDGGVLSANAFCGANTEPISLEPKITRAAGPRQYHSGTGLKRCSSPQLASLFRRLTTP